MSGNLHCVLVSGKSKSSANGPAGGGGRGGGGGMMNGGAPQLAGLFAGGMPKLKPAGKGPSSSRKYCIVATMMFLLISEKKM